jgi:DNA-binding MarR family transcriptional regulator
MAEELMETDQPFVCLLHAVAMSVRSRVTATVLGPLGLTFPQYLCLRSLLGSTGRTNADLARAMRVSPQAMNVLVRGLLERGFVQRPTSAVGGRQVPMTLTDTGRALVKRADYGVSKAEKHVLDGLPTQDRRALRQTFAKMGYAVM